MSKVFHFILLGILAFSFGAELTCAATATNDFTVRTFVGNDVLPPTIPASLVVTPIATSQINLNWTASTDDFELTGYHVWRDNVQVATTTALSYSDVGLSASTTYSYYVTAYDWIFNESASSTEIATTTFSIPPPPPTPTTTPSDGSQSGSRIPPFDEMLVSIEILPQMDSVVIRYETKGHIRSVIKWGRTSSYELGSLAEQAFSMTHETRITGLTPGTLYSFVIEGENRLARYGIIYEGSFTTLPPDDTFAPGNVSDFVATKNGTDIDLTWTNPKDLDFDKVRVVESDLFYPGDIADGWVVYEGEGTSAESRGKALPGSTHYYTIFAYDTLGNISSGAVAILKVSAEGVISTTTPITPMPEPSEPPTEPATTTQASSTLETPIPVVPYFVFTFDDIRFSQEGEFISGGEGIVNVDGSKQLTVSIPYGVLPEHLKTILAVLGSSENPGKQFSFLLRVNEAKTEYTATLAPLGVSGEFPIQLSIFDFKTTQIGYAEGTVISKIRSLHLDDDSQDFGAYFISFISKIGRSYLLWFTVFLVILAFMGRRLMKTEW